MPQILKSCVVAGGSGRVGRLFIRRLSQSGVAVTSVDVVDNQYSGECVMGDIRAPHDQLAKLLTLADAVFLVVPEQVALDAVEPVAARMTSGALLVDTLSVKSHILEAYQRQGDDLEILSINPMFAPELDIRGRPIATIRIRSGPRCQAFEQLIQSWGARLVPLDAAEHDKLMAICQAATHATILGFGLMLKNSGENLANLRNIAPPPHLTMLALLSRILSGTPEVYQDIQRGNPAAQAVRESLSEAFGQLATALQHDTDFGDLLADLKAYMGAEREELAAVCETLFQNIPNP